ncbi:hypothetical protein [Subtercola boreus]|uniref:hypothetical protein n=1 Tax=Subtercola boreus TaxID=120213 RepID=UPI0011C03EAB|nr:hypothetical protein [Subtercola boreus]
MLILIKRFLRSLALSACTVVAAAIFIVIPASSSSALGCVLGPSLGAAAAKVGISCPTVEGDGGIEGEGGGAWGSAPGACRYGWSNANLPAGLFDYLQTLPSKTNDFMVGRQHINQTVFQKNGKFAGRISITFRDDSSFVMTVDLLNRSWGSHEFVYFDCAQSSGGPTYENLGGSLFLAMPGSTDPVPAGVRGSIVAHGATSSLPAKKFLLRVDVTNAGTSNNYAEIDLGLAGYSIDTIPTLPAGMNCVPLEGLICSYNGLNAGQTVTVVLVLSQENDLPGGTPVDIAVSASGFQKVHVVDGVVALNRPVTVSNLYRITPL